MLMTTLIQHKIIDAMNYASQTGLSLKLHGALSDGTTGYASTLGN